MEQVILSTVHLNIPKSKEYSVTVKKTDIQHLKDNDGREDVIAIVGSRAMTEATVKLSFPNLRMFQLTSAGFDHVPLEYYHEHGIAVCNAGSVYSVPIAETVVYGMLQYAKRYWKNPRHHFLRPIRKYRYIIELAGKKAIVLGCGNIGTAVAKRLKAFEVSVDGYDPYCAQKPEYGCILKTRVELLKAIGQYQYIITTLPDNEETNGLINQELFGAMNSQAVIVNVGRRAVFNQEDFLKALKTHRIAGAVLDMFEKAPNPITNPYRRLSNVIILPGVSAISQEVNGRLKAHIEKNCQRILRSKEPMYRIV